MDYPDQPRPFEPGEPFAHGAHWGFTFSDAAGDVHRCTHFPDLTAEAAERTMRLFVATVGDNDAVILHRRGLGA